MATSSFSISVYYCHSYPQHYSLSNAYLYLLLLPFFIYHSSSAFFIIKKTLQFVIVSERVRESKSKWCDCVLHTMFFDCFARNIQALNTISNERMKNNKLVTKIPSSCPNRTASTRTDYSHKLAMS